MRWCNPHKGAPGIAASVRRRKEVIRFQATPFGRVEVPHHDVLDFDRLDPFSVSFWLKTTTAAFQTLMTKTDGPTYRGWMVHINEAVAGRIHFRLDNTIFTNGMSCSFTFAANDGAWHHFVLTHSGSGTIAGITGYVDAVSRAKTNVADFLSATTLTTAPVRMGGHVESGYTGQLDECAVWDKALSGAEVTTIYNGGAVVDYSGGGMPSNLVGYWRMGEGSFYPTIPDASSNSNDGTMVNLSPGDRINRRP